MDKKKTTMSKKSLVLFVAAIILLLASAVSGTRAALVMSQEYQSQIATSQIGVTLLENEKAVSRRDYNGNKGEWSPVDEQHGTLLTGLDDLKVGQRYDEQLAVQNSGSIDQFVRVQVYKYWGTRQEDGTIVKNPNLSPSLIDLHFCEDNGWIVGSTSDERTVLYYSKILKGADNPDSKNEAVSALFADTIKIDNAVATKVSESAPDENGVITTTYAYDGAEFFIDVEVDAVQTHNAADAMLSAWGIHATIANAETDDATITAVN